MIPMGGHIIRPNPTLMDTIRIFISAWVWRLRTSRASMKCRAKSRTQFALRSHQRAVAALDADKFKDETVPLNGLCRRAGRKRQEATPRNHF